MKVLQQTPMGEGFLSKMGEGFLSKKSCEETPSPILLR